MQLASEESQQFMASDRLATGGTLHFRPRRVLVDSAWEALRNREVERRWKETLDAISETSRCCLHSILIL